MKVVQGEVIGPFKLHGRDPLLFDEKVSELRGIYIWGREYEEGYLISYIGETITSFKKRMKEHLIQILGGNYRIIDPKEAKQGKQKIVWNGLWRKGTRDKINEFIDQYDELAPIIVEHIKSINVFLIPLEVDKRTQYLIEGNMAIDIKESKPPTSNLLPQDIRYWYKLKKKEEPIKMSIECKYSIYGLKSEYIIEKKD